MCKVNLDKLFLKYIMDIRTPNKKISKGFEQ